jgi:hypothetical protein
MRKAPKIKSKVRFTIIIDASLLALARTAAHQREGLTLASLCEAGLRQIIKRLEQQRGRPFRPKPVRLPAGRPRHDRLLKTGHKRRRRR